MRKPPVVTAIQMDIEFEWQGEVQKSKLRDRRETLRLLVLLALVGFVGFSNSKALERPKLIRPDRASVWSYILSK